MTSRATSTNSRRGQTLPIVVWMVAIVVVLLVVVFDIFFSARAKMHLANTGDAAALAAARWQGTTLNLIGDLNLAHLAAACDETLLPSDRTNIINGINALAERLAFAGPVMAFHAANEAVRLNHEANLAHRNDRTIPVDHNLAEILRREIAYARAEVGSTPSWPTKGDDYADMLQGILNAGVFVGADNARLLSGGATGSHIYYARGFYDAAAPNGPKQWFCRYNHNRHRLSEDACHNPTADDLETLGSASIQNAGLFGVAVEAHHVLLEAVSPDAANVLAQLWHDYVGTAEVDAARIRESGLLFDPYFAWYFLSPSPYGLWRRWHEINEDSEGLLPLVGTVRTEYDVYGAMAATRVRRSIVTISSPVTNAVDWMAAAKPFGMLPGDRRVTDMFGEWEPRDTLDRAPLVMPAYSFVRLVPLGGVGEGNLYKADAAWLAHLEHLRNNTRVPGCWRCNRLNEWENGGREEAARWFSTHAHDEYCDPPGKGGRHDSDPFNG